MATVGITFPVGEVSNVGVLDLDVMLTESNDLSAKATEYVVEDGSPISDHVIVESEKLKLSGWITPSDIVQMTATGRPKLIDAKATLRKIMTDRQTVTVITGLDSYSDMVVETCSIGRSNEGDRLTVDLSLVKIRKAVLRRVAIPAERTSGTARGKAGQTKTKAGKVTPAEPAPPVKSKLKELVTR